MRISLARDPGEYLGLNLGSGPHYADDWLNIDAVDPEVGRPPDLLADAFEALHALPRTSFPSAYFGHVIEHVPWTIVPDLLALTATRLVRGATIMVVGPCLYRAIETRQPRSLIEAIVADPRHSGPLGHEWTPTTDLTLEALRRAGLEGVREVKIDTVTRPQWPNPSTASWQVAAMGFAS